jgi:hypothetical protein
MMKRFCSEDTISASSTAEIDRNNSEEQPNSSQTSKEDIPPIAALIGFKRRLAWKLRM